MDGTSDLDPSPTGKLLERARAGDREAESRFYSLFRCIVVEHARNHALMHRLRAFFSQDDVVNEVWVRCRESGYFDSFQSRGRGTFRCFLGKVLHHVLVDMMRRVQSIKRRGTFAQQEADDDGVNGGGADCIPSRDPTPTSHARVAEVKAFVGSLLDETELAVWRLTEEEGLNSTEVGARLGITAAAARALLYRARRKLILHLSRELGEKR
ncbi:MAG: ECF-type sigma factor [Planctomycetota bacterium]